MVKVIAKLRFYGNAYVAENMTKMANKGFMIQDEPILTTTAVIQHFTPGYHLKQPIR
jgi:hypothetical protein